MSKVEECILLDFKAYYENLNKRVWYWHKDRHIDQQNKIESSKINPYIYGQLIFSEGYKTIK